MNRKKEREPGPTGAVEINPAQFVRRLRAIEDVQWADLKPFLDDEKPLPETFEELMKMAVKVKRMLQSLLTLKMEVLQTRQDILQVGYLTEEDREDIILGYDSILRSIDIVFERVSRLRSKVSAGLRHEHKKPLS